MPQRIALLIDADQWPPTALYSVLEAARAIAGAGMEAHAFGVFEREPLSAWARHYKECGVKLVPVGPGRDKADDALRTSARNVAAEGAVQEIWVASRDRALLEKIATEARSCTLVVPREPEALTLPTGMKWQDVPLARREVPPDVMGQLKEACGTGGWKPFGNVGQAFPDRDGVARRCGRRTLLELYQTLDEFEVRDAAGGPEVRLAGP